MFVLTIIMVFLGVVTNFLGKSEKGRFINFIIAYIVIVALCGLVRYTPDWAGYELWLEIGSEREVFFKIIGAIIVENDFGYRHLHLMFIGVYTLLMLMFIRKFETIPFLTVILFLSINFLFYTTQIRFFLAYFSCALAFYYSVVERRPALSILFAILGLLNHYSVLLFLPFFYFFRRQTFDLDRRIILTSIILCAFFFVGNQVIEFLIGGTFGGYLNPDKVSSFFGGVYFFFPTIVSYFLIYNLTANLIKHRPDILEDKKFVFLYKLAFVPYIYIGVSLFIQIIGHRFIYPALLFQIMLVFHLLKYFPKDKRSDIHLKLAFFFMFFVAYLYYLPTIIFGESATLDEVKKILTSNAILNYILE